MTDRQPEIRLSRIRRTKKGLCRTKSVSKSLVDVQVLILRGIVSLIPADFGANRVKPKLVLETGLFQGVCFRQCNRAGCTGFSVQSLKD